MPSVIDANCWCLYVDEQVRGAPGLGCSVFTKAEADGVLFDSGKIIRQQYIDMRQPYAEQIFDNWFGEKVIYGSARVISVASNAAVNKALRVLNIPSKEHVYFKTAVSGSAGYIVSIDTDFFDPAAKNSAKKKRSK